MAGRVVLVLLRPEERYLPEPRSFQVPWSTSYGEPMQLHGLQLIVSPQSLEHELFNLAGLAKTAARLLNMCKVR